MTYRINDNGIERDMTAQEAAEYEQTAADAVARAAREAQVIADRAAAVASARAKLAKLGLTDDEIDAFLA